MERVTVSSSLRHKELIKSTISVLDESGVTALFPNLDSGVAKEDVDVAFMRKLERDHFGAIEESDGLYVICPEGRVGILVSVEIGYAHALGKPVIFSEQPEDLGLQALSDGIISLNEVGRIKDRKAEK